ncbi:MAG: histidine phosphatase family protein [Defluviitaleaceae bacterium]|nr:histidine phosphatase family protein [Defluviitaleaceae bacterium]
MMQIHIVRHGKTVANEQRLYCGATDLPLSENGITELKELKAQGIYPKHVDLYFTSGLMRTDETLDLLYGPVQRETLPQLMEYHFGEFEMKDYETLKDQDDYQAWITDENGQVSCPGGDNKQDFTRRVIEGLELLKKRANEKSALAVVHGGVIASIMEHLFPNTRNFYEWQPKPGYGYTLTHTPDGQLLYKSI